MKPTLLPRSLLLGSSMLAAVSTTNAQSTWDGDTSNSWGISSNWDNNTVPNATGASAIFTSVSPSGYDIFLGGGNRIANLTFDSTTGSTPYTIKMYDTDGTTERTLTTGGITAQAGDHTIEGPKPGSGTIGSLFLQNNTAFDISAGTTLTLDARLRSGAGTNNYTKSGTGTLILNADNGGGSSWSFGTFSVDAGIVRMSANNATGFSGNKYTVASGAAIELNNVNFGSVNAAQTISGSGIGGTGVVRSLSGNRNFGTIAGTGSLTLAADSAIGVDADSLNIGFAIGESGGSRSLTKVGTGLLTLSNANTYTGNTTISQGVLQIGDGTNNTGTLGNNNESDTSIAAGAELRINRTDNFGYDYRGELSGSGTVTVMPSMRMNLRTDQPSSGDLSFVVGSTAILGINTSDGVSSVELGELSGSGTIQRGGPASGAATLVIGGKGTNSTFDGRIRNPELGVEKVGAGSLTLTGDNDYSGTTFVSAGTLLVNGSLGNTNVTVDPLATLGGTGSIAGSLSLAATSFLQVVDLDNPLAVAGSISFGSGFGIDNLLGINWDSLDLNTPYTVLETTQTFGTGDIGDFGIDNAVEVGATGRQAYFTNGSLAVIVIPEPATALLSTLGILALLRRRRA